MKPGRIANGKERGKFIEETINSGRGGKLHQMIIR